MKYVSFKEALNIIRTSPQAYYMTVEGEILNVLSLSVVAQVDGDWEFIEADKLEKSLCLFPGCGPGYYLHLNNAHVFKYEVVIKYKNRPDDEIELDDEENVEDESSDELSDENSH